MPIIETNTRCAPVKKCGDIECLNQKKCHCHAGQETGKIVECPGSISVNLDIININNIPESRQVIINVQSLLNSQDFTGIYRTNTRNDPIGFGTVYYVIMKDDIRNTFYLLFITGTREVPIYFGSAGIRQSLPIAINGIEVEINDSGFNSFLLESFFLGSTPLALYSNKNKSSFNTNALVALFSVGQQPIQLLTKLRKIDDNLYNALQKNTMPSSILPNKNLKTSVYQEVDYVGPAYVEAVTGPLRKNAIKKLEQYLAGPVEYHYEILDIFSVTSLIITFPLTTIITDKTHRFNFYSRVIISGFRKEWSILNGQHIVTPWYSNFMTPKGWVCPDARKNYLAIYFDTSQLPVYNPDIHGHAKISGTNKQITATSEFGDLRSAQIDIFFDLNYTTHNVSILDGYIDSQNQLLPISTYKQLLDTSIDGTYLEILQNTFRIGIPNI